MLLNQKQQQAIEILNSGANVHLFGEGGTGKSFVIRYYLDNLSRKERETTMIVAPTGIAALNVGGVTIHRAFKVPVQPLGPHKNPPAKVSDCLKNATRIIIDEISMCRFDVFEYVTKCIRLAEESQKRKIQVIVVGDMLQLPPVITDEDREALIKLWEVEDIGSGFPFEAPLWNSYNFKNCYLDEIMRVQKDEIELIKNLNLCRKGDKSCIEFYNNLANKPNNSAIHLCPTNKSADKINNREVEKFAKRISYDATAIGEVKPSDKVVPDHLEFAKGMRVMVVVNGEKYKNGEIGTVKSVNNNSIIVDFSGNSVEIVENTWEIENYSVRLEDGVPKLFKEVVGKYSQMPLKPAYAITMHKSQGQTFNEVVVHPNCFAAGQLYVAISRCSNLKGLSFSSKIKPDYLIADADSLRFYEEIEKKVEFVTKSKTSGRGGARKGAGRKSMLGETKVMRVPTALIPEIQALIDEYIKQRER